MDHFTATIPDEAHSPGAVLWVAAPLSMLLRIIYYSLSNCWELTIMQNGVLLVIINKVNTVYCAIMIGKRSGLKMQKCLCMTNTWPVMRARMV